jgi:hypothetical protein
VGIQLLIPPSIRSNCLFLCLDFKLMMEEEREAVKGGDRVRSAPNGDSAYAADAKWDTRTSSQCKQAAGDK